VAPVFERATLAGRIVIMLQTIVIGLEVMPLHIRLIQVLLPYLWSAYKLLVVEPCPTPLNPAQSGLRHVLDFSPKYSNYRAFSAFTSNLSFYKRSKL
jgi:uncharacterized SAM-binding protein YcdF (DUF218 family)